ncbi:MAG TPA: SCP2 sterol-binding domain-containing protein [Burkholderiaceae bacterium]|nr:SCP2 sterol-binding domain-containing protein [Burkholderiaceae bacterium]
MLSMLSTLPPVPAPLARLAAKLPAYPGSWLFAAGLNRFLRHHFPEDTLEAMEDKVVCIHVRDAEVAFDVQWQGQRFQAVAPGADVALTISATVADFWCLLQRHEDPDTLFFNRRLTMKGDTELGLWIKNSLDAIDLSDVLPGGFVARSPGHAGKR